MLGSDSWEYCELLKKQIKTSNVSIEKLSEGLCSPSMLSRICNGERTANKMMRDRLMQRLGMADDRNENFIFNEEYKKWKIRQRIVILINEENLVEAEELLNVYEKNLCNKVEEQFVQVMRIQIYQMRELESEKLKKLYENALKLTVPHIDEKKVNELQLSVQELNLVLEYMNYCYPDKLYSKCEELNEYVKKVIMDEQCRAKILPKIILYQCRTLHNKKEVNYILLLKKCNIAIECLRDAKRMFFLWELLQEREWIYEKIISDLIQKEENESIALMFFYNNIIFPIVTGFLYGISNGFVSIMNGVLLQINTPRKMMGRVFSAFRCVSFASGPVGIIIVGYLGEYISLNKIFFYLGCLLIMTSFISFKYTAKSQIEC